MSAGEFTIELARVIAPSAASIAIAAFGLKWLWSDVRRWFAKRGLVHRRNAYWPKSGDGGPFCVACLHKLGQRVPMERRASDYRDCPVCLRTVDTSANPGAYVGGTEVADTGF